MIPGYKLSNTIKSCANCQHYELGYCELFNEVVEDDYICNLWLPNAFEFDVKVKKYAHIDFNVTDAMVNAAKRGLEVRAKKPASQRGGTAVGLARARDISARKTLSPSTWRRMLSYFQRHEVDKQGSTWSEQGKGWQAWQLWGGDAGYARARKIVKQMNAADNK